MSLNEAQIEAAHRAHIEKGASIIAIARSDWEKLGYASADSLSFALRTAFKKRGLAVRPATESLVPFQPKPPAVAAPEPQNEWVRVSAAEWRNFATGGRASPAACGWCGRPVVWPVEGHGHSWGICIDPIAAAERKRAHDERPRRGRKRQVPA